MRIALATRNRHKVGAGRTFFASSAHLRDVAVDVVPKTITNDHYPAESCRSGGFEASVCSSGSGMANLLLRAPLKLDSSQVTWSGVEDVDQGERGESQR